MCAKRSKPGHMTCTALSAESFIYRSYPGGGVMSSLSTLERALMGVPWPWQSPALQKDLLLRVSPFRWYMAEGLHMYVGPWNDCGLMLDALLAASDRAGTNCKHE